MKKETLVVDNIKCGGCAANIKDSLLKVKTVEKVMVNVEKSEVSIEYDGNTDRSVFVEKLSGMGYPELGTSTLFQKGKSYVSCAIGKVKQQVHDSEMN